MGRSVSVVAEQLAVPGSASFSYREAGDGQGGDRIGPPPAEGCEENQPEQRGNREGGADDRFGGIGQDELVAQQSADTALAPAQQRHDKQRADGKSDADG